MRNDTIIISKYLCARQLNDSSTHPLQLYWVVVASEQLIYQGPDRAPSPLLGYSRRICYSFSYLFPCTFVTLYLFKDLLRVQQHPLDFLVNIALCICGRGVLEVQEYIVPRWRTTIRVVARQKTQQFPHCRINKAQFIRNTFLIANTALPNKFSGIKLSHKRSYITDSTSIII